MHRLRAAAKRPAWYSEEDDPNPDYNPFRKTRARNQDSDQAGQYLNRSESNLTLKFERQRRLAALEALPPPSRSEPESNGNQPALLEAEEFSHTDDEATPVKSQKLWNLSKASKQDIRGSLDEEHGISLPSRTSASWRSWSQRALPHLWHRLVLASGSRRSGDVKRSVAGMGLSVLSHAPLGTKGAPFLRGPGRRRKFIIIKYEKQGDNIKDATTDVGEELPGFCFYEKQSPGDEESVKTLRKDLFEYLSVRGFSNSSPSLRIIYIQDDPESLRHIYGKFHIRFARHRTDFLEWSIGKAVDNTQQQATDFWRPTSDKAYNIVRTAFGLEYPVPRPVIIFDIESDGGVSRKSTTGSSKKQPEIVPDCCSQRLSVFIQSKETGDPSKQLGSAVKDRLPFTLDNNVIIFDSMYEGVPTGELIAGKGSWQQLHDDLESVDNPILSATIQLIFDAIAGKWSDYILFMHNYIVALEEVIYDQPADDRQAPTLWSISKQLLQAERLMKFHVLLLENVQRDLTNLPGNTTRPDWLGQNLSEFNRLSSEVEETLKKPVAHMVDLMYKSISIRDARQSLELNTSMWRLSWITFIFLPLTFLAGVFGMNVSELKANPSLKWYFITASPLMVLVMISWLSARRWMRKDVDIVDASHQRHTAAL